MEHIMIDDPNSIGARKYWIS